MYISPYTVSVDHHQSSSAFVGWSYGGKVIGKTNDFGEMGYFSGEIAVDDDVQGADWGLIGRNTLLSLRGVTDWHNLEDISETIDTALSIIGEVIHSSEGVQREELDLLDGLFSL